MVGEDLAQAQRVAMHHGGQVGFFAEAQLQTALVGTGGQQLQRVLDQGAQHEVALGQLHMAGFDLGEVQDVVDDLQQAFS